MRSTHLPSKPANQQSTNHKLRNPRTQNLELPKIPNINPSTPDYKRNNNVINQLKFETAQINQKCKPKTTKQSSIQKAHQETCKYQPLYYPNLKQTSNPSYQKIQKILNLENSEPKKPERETCKFKDQISQNPEIQKHQKVTLNKYPRIKGTV